MAERTRSRVQAAEMSFLRRVAGVSGSVRSSVIREELGLEPLLLYLERSQLGGKDAHWAPPLGGVSGTSSGEETSDRKSVV